MVGLPSSWKPIYLLPWFALLCSLWAARRLSANTSHSRAQRVHRWVVLAGLVALLAMLATAGLLIPTEV
jgi:hypothetical protein